jgi:hypothetical protein
MMVVVRLVKLARIRIRCVNIYDAEHKVLDAFRRTGTGLNLVVSIPNELLKDTWPPTRPRPWTDGLAERERASVRTTRPRASSASPWATRCWAGRTPGSPRRSSAPSSTTLSVTPRRRAQDAPAGRTPRSSSPRRTRRPSSPTPIHPPSACVFRDDCVPPPAARLLFKDRRALLRQRLPVPRLHERAVAHRRQLHALAVIVDPKTGWLACPTPSWTPPTSRSRPRATRAWRCAWRRRDGPPPATPRRPAPTWGTPHVQPQPSEAAVPAQGDALQARPPSDTTTSSSPTAASPLSIHISLKGLCRRRRRHRRLLPCPLR